MWIPKFMKEYIKKYKRELHIRRLKYALSRLNTPHHNDLEECERPYLIEVVSWLLSYYQGDPDASGDGPPEDRLRKILAKSSTLATPRDHVYSRVLLYWKEHKRIEGF